MENDTQTTQYDPQAVAMVRALKMQESGNDYNAPKEKAGNSLGGAYQYQADTWKNYAGQVLGDPNAPFTPENQDKVTYGMVKKWKDNGMQPADIAHQWNPGDPQYPDSVVNHLKQIVQGASPKGSGYVQVPSTPQPQEQVTPPDTTQQPEQPQSDLMGKLSNRASALGTDIGKATGGVSDILKGNIAQGGKEIFHGLVQGAGAIAGGLGDTVNTALENTPIVGGVLKGLEGIIGTGVQSFTQTPAGQSVVQHLSDFAKTHPELSADMGAGLNIVTAIPILKGLGVVKDVALDGASLALKRQAENAVAKEATSVVSKTSTGSEFMMKNPDAVKNMIDERLMPEISGTEYDALPAFKQSQSTIKSLNNDVANSLGKYTDIQVDTSPIMKDVLEGYKDKNGIMQTALSKSEYTPEDIFSTARELVPSVGKLWTKFEEGNASLAEVNELRSKLDGAVESVYSKTTLPPAKKEIGATLAGAMRKYVQTTAPETVPAFNRMSNIYKVQKVLKYMNKKPVKSGMVGGFIKSSTQDIPVVRQAGKSISSKMAGVSTGILKRTGRNAKRVTAKEAGTKIRKGITAGLIQQANPPNQQTQQ